MEHRTGIEDCYVIKNNKKLRMGYTTGSCAAGAAKAAAWMLLNGQEIDTVSLVTPKGIELSLELFDIDRKDNCVSCAVRKDGGDDPDATNGILVYARVEKSPEPGILIDGGEGVGRVTKPGLEQPVGSAAINRVPRLMIRQGIEEICEAAGYTGGISVVISIPGGAAIAQKTFNPRLGILGGISVLGTSGIVEPMSEAALIRSIQVEMNMLTAAGAQYLLITPGNYGQTFVREQMHLDLDQAMKCSNFVGETIDMAVESGVKGILFVAHIGKFIKVAGGIMNTHSRCADSRAELMTAFALRAGATLEQAKALLDTLTTEEAVTLLEQYGLKEAVMPLIAEKIIYYLDHRAYGKLEFGLVLFSNEHGLLAMTDNVQEMIGKLETGGRSE
ncbi:MAG: cobalt-precorrin-5B (C(1))-methyltransferase CbiD [Lachnospiraceae bacterium]|nr:cobalt-precorrin-5B (C(1))-methyltransferase CbiD [Lachnospiraceae bacterium]